MSERDAGEVVESWLALGTPFRAGGSRQSRVVARRRTGGSMRPRSAFLLLPLPQGAARACCARLRGIALDLPGLGAAERPYDFDYRWSGLAKWLNAALGEIGIAHGHLVVHDIGGPITFETLRLHPERAASITALDTIARPTRFRRPPGARALARPLIGRLALEATTRANSRRPCARTASLARYRARRSAPSATTVGLHFIQESAAAEIAEHVSTLAHTIEAQASPS